MRPCAGPQHGTGSLPGAAWRLVAFLLAVLAGYAERTVFSSDQFADRAAAALRDDRVSSRVAAKLTDEVVLANAADLLAARPLIEQAADGVVRDAAFRQLIRAAVRDVHAAVFNRDLDTVTRTVADAGTVVAAAVEALQPSVAEKIRDDARITPVREQVDDRAADLARVAEDVRLLATVLTLLSLGLAVAGIALASDRRRAVGRLGSGAAAAVGVLIVVGFAVARWAVLREIAQEDDRDALAGIWDAYLADLRAAGRVLAASGRWSPPPPRRSSRRSGSSLRCAGSPAGSRWSRRIPPCAYRAVSPSSPRAR